MKITEGLDLTSVAVDGVAYVEWRCGCSLEDERVRARWRAFARKYAAGKDDRGLYYTDRAHANRVIREFRAKELKRAKEPIE